MKNILIFIVLCFLFGSCTSTPVNKHTSFQCIKSFVYTKQHAVGPETLVGVIATNDNELRRLLLNKPSHFVFNISGGIYNVDSIYFPLPYVDIYDIRDTSIFFVQDIFGLRQIPANTLDSLIRRTEMDIHVEILDTITNKKWVIMKCRD